MSKFKVGDRVKISPNSNYYTGGLFNPKDEIGRITKFNEGFLPIMVEWSQRSNGYNESDLILTEKTMDNLQVGDVVESTSSYTKKVVQVTGLIIVTEDSDDEELNVTTANNLKRNDWNLKTREEEVKEMTVEEVSKLVGKTVKIVK